MTALAYSITPEPALDFFDNENPVVPPRPNLRLIQGEGLDARLAAQAATVEVYRRRRFLLLLVAMVVAVGIALASGVSVSSFGGTATPISDSAPAVHTVLPGDSYGAIAAELGAANPVAAAVQLQAANGGGELVIGQRLVVDLALLQAGS